jgi:hypothetical protein
MTIEKRKNWTERIDGVVMKGKRGFQTRVRHRLTCFIFLYGFVMIASAQQPQRTADERGATGNGFDTLDAATVVGNRRPGKSAQKRRYQTSRAFPHRIPPRGKTFMTVGVTIARGRLATDAEINTSDVAKVRGCVQWEERKCANRKEMVLERMSDNSAVSDKDQIQMTIEYLAYLDASRDKQSNHIGYLYVINREQYPDGTYSKPKLIFPTLNTYGGDNRVMPGKTVIMPDPERPWTISRSDSGKVQAFETYTLVVSPEPLKELSGQELQLEANQIMLDEKLFSSWVRLWGGNESRGDLESGAGQLITQREVKSSGSLNRKRSTNDDVDDLNLDDPPPQIIFRKVVNPGGKMLVTVRLPYKEAAAPSQTQKQ